MIVEREAAVAVPGGWPDGPEDSDQEPRVVIAVTADISARALLALQMPRDSVLMLFPDQATALRTIGTVGPGALAPVVLAPPPGAGSPDGPVASAGTVPEEVPPSRDRAGLSVDQLRERVTWNGEPLQLTRLERRVLGCLAARPDQVWTYGRLYQTVWGSAWLGDSSTLHAVVKRLRRKLRDAGVTVAVEAVRGVGFRLTG